MNIYFIAVTIAVIDTYLSYRYYLRSKKRKLGLSILCFLVSFYIALKLLSGSTENFTFFAVDGCSNSIELA